MGRRLTVAALASVTAVGALALVAIFNSPVGSPPPQRPQPAVAGPGSGTVGASLTSAIPAHPVSAITTPATREWWAFIARMAPMAHLHGVDITKAGVPVAGYAYSTSEVRTSDVAQNLPTYGAVYVQTTTVEDADRLINWLADQPGAEHRRAYRTGLIVIIGPEWADRSEFILDTTSTTQTLAANAGKPNKVATWFWDAGQWVDLTHKRATAPQARAAVQGLTAALGLTDTTAFTVSAANPQGPWTGTATGHRFAAVNVNALSAAVASSDKIIAERKGSDGTTFAVTQTGLGGLERTGGVSVFRAGQVAQTYGRAAPNNLLTGAQTSMAAQINTHQITDYALGFTTENAGPDAVAFQVSETGQAVLAPVFAAK